MQCAHNVQLKRFQLAAEGLEKIAELPADLEADAPARARHEDVEPRSRLLHVFRFYVVQHFMLATLRGSLRFLINLIF